MDKTIISARLDQMYQGLTTRPRPRHLYLNIAAIKGHEADYRAAEYLRMAAAVFSEKEHRAG